MEIWKPLRNFPSYNGSSEGRIMNVRTQRILKPTITEKGYAVVGLRKNNKYYTVRVHKVIAETFLGEHPGMDVKHKDLDPLNNNVDNLYWISRSDIVKQTYDSGRRKPWRQIPVRVIETGKIYENMKECAIDIGCDPAEVRKCIIGERRSAKGYHFEPI
jgi:hypothetical protein